jgi:hypothetical protein
MSQNVYQENGYANRQEYLKSLADDYGVDIETVEAISDGCGGEHEDFDGLVAMLKDFC